MTHSKDNVTNGTPLSSERLRVNFRSSRCVLNIGNNVIMDDLEINFNGPSQSVTIGDNCKIRGVIHLINWDNHVSIGAGTICNSMIWMSVCENSCRIDIGENCLFANVKFRTSDSHKIFDVETNERLNPGKSIRICDRVWIAEDAIIYKGVEIANDSIVAGRSLVVSNIPANSLAGGSPAKVLKSGVRWQA